MQALNQNEISAISGGWKTTAEIDEIYANYVNVGSTVGTIAGCVAGTALGASFGGGVFGALYLGALSLIPGFVAGGFVGALAAGVTITVEN